MLISRGTLFNEDDDEDDDEESRWILIFMNNFQWILLNICYLVVLTPGKCGRKEKLEKTKKKEKAACWEHVEDALTAQLYLSVLARGEIIGYLLLLRWARYG